MFRIFRLVRKWKFFQLISMFCVLSTILVCWDDVNHHALSHVKSYTYRYLINSYEFINKSFSVSREQADAFGRFEYLIDPKDVCSEKDVLLLLFVKSSPENSKRRQIIRSTWGNQTYIRQDLGVNVKLVFVMGVHSNPHQRETFQTKLRDEEQTHADLLQQNFLDTFHNLTIKLLLQFRWAHFNCGHARFLMSSDDDVFVHMPNLVSSLQTLKKQDLENLWIGHVHRGAPPVRLRSSKYYVSYQMYQYSSYPDYTAGAGYVVSREVAAKIYQATMTLNASLHIDDVFMGICAAAVGVSPQEHVYFAGEAKTPYHPCIYEKMITSHGHEDDVPYLWKAATRPEVKDISSGFFGNLYCKAVKFVLLCKPFFSNTYSCWAAFT